MTGPAWNRFDICEAYYVFALLWHGGQSGPEYRILGRLNDIGFRPAPRLAGPRDLSPNGRAIYWRLVARAKARLHGHRRGC